MSKTTIPSGYRMPLSNNELQRAIELIHQEFQHSLCVRLNLHRVSAPLFVDGRTGLNDDLNGVERPVSFDIPDVGTDGQVVHSLAKWKRLALKRYEFPEGTGLYTNMNAIRRDEEVDNLHSIYVDQWDWEKVIERRDRTVDFLEQTVRAIVGAVVETNDALQIAFPSLHTVLDREVYFVTTQELEDRWPDYTPKQREDAICKEHHTVFLMQIGDDLHRSGKPHDGRAPDYDDWALNGDILMYDPVLDRSFEISSMGRTVCADGEPFMPQTPSAYGEADDPCDGKDGDAGDQHRPSSGKRVERQLEGRTERRPCGDGGRRAPGLGVEAEGYAGVDQNVRQLADDDESQHDEDVERACRARARRASTGRSGTRHPPRHSRFHARPASHGRVPPT